MMDPEVHRMLGQMQGTMASIQRQLAENEASARESRGVVYKSLQEIRENAQDTRRRTEALEKVIASEIRPVVRGVLDLRSRALGATMVLGILGSAILLVLTAARDAVTDIWRALFDR